MHIRYDEKADVLDIRFNDLPYHPTHALNDVVSLDLNHEGALMSNRNFARVTPNPRVGDVHRVR
jgi:hypothetical protein